MIFLRLRLPPRSSVLSVAERSKQKLSGIDGVLAGE